MENIHPLNNDTRKQVLEEINRQGISIVIGARNEEKTVALTIGNIIENMYSSGIEKFEIILMDNASSDETSRFFAWKIAQKLPREKWIYSPRGLVTSGRLRIFYDPIPSNVGTRNNGARWARYENIIFADAHIIIRQDTILSTFATLNKYGGIVHAPVSWLGASPFDPDPGYQYSYKVGEKIFGTWNKIKIADTPFYIPLCGHCWLAVKRTEFFERGGYPQAQRVYGGGEPYLDTVYWMTGGSSMCDPGSLVYHLSAGRGYNWHSNDLLHNMLLVSYILGGQKWLDRIRITYLNKQGSNEHVVNLLTQEAVQEGEADRLRLEEKRLMTFEELLRLDWVNDCNNCTKRRRPEPHPMRIWDKMNDELHGKHHSYVAEFKLERREDKIFIGETEIVQPSALEIAKRYV